MKSNTPKDKFGDDFMVTGETSQKAADRAALILACCRGARHVLTPLAWVACSAFLYFALRLVA